jgi:hypothetical protein
MSSIVPIRLIVLGKCLAPSVYVLNGTYADWFQIGHFAKYRMDILSPIQFHDALNSRLWRGDKLRPEVRLKLFQAAVAFYRFLDIPKLVVTDIIITGSNAAFNYTRLSDIDIHLLVDFANTACPALASNFFTTKKALWAKTYDVTVHGHPLELYVEDTDEPVKANGVYSVLHGEWIKVPTQSKPTLDDSAIKHKVRSFAAEIEAMLEGEPTNKDIGTMLRKLYVLRQNGLLKCGEFSTENLAFKSLRAMGYIDLLHDKRTAIRDAELSLPLKPSD